MKTFEIHYKVDNKKLWMDFSAKNLREAKRNFMNAHFDKTGRLVEIVAVYPLN